MKKFTIFLLALSIFSTGYSQTGKKKRSGKVVKKTAVKPAVQPMATDQANQVAPMAETPVDNTPPVVNTAAVKNYGNYDFVPGDTVVFEDHFTDDQIGEFPAHWKLGAGQGIMNMLSGQRALLLTAGNYAHVTPLIKSPAYFGDAFTIEYDFYVNNGYGPKFYFYNNNKDAKAAENPIGSVSLQPKDVTVAVESADVNLTAQLSPDLVEKDYDNNWHHMAIAYKRNQLKIYVDQFRALVVPNLGIAPHAFDIEGIGDENTPIVLANFRVARGAGMNMMGQKFTAAKIVTHGINFDLDKATIKAESMGTLNMIAGILKENPEVKFEIDGHTDASGMAAHNMALSQQRAAAVKAQLAVMGVDAARLTIKGFGSSKPISDNTTMEGMANNRRVEFIRM